MPAACGPAGRHGATGAAPLLALQRRPGNTAVSRLVVQRYEAWEHRQLGDALGGEHQRRITLPNGFALTYGQVVALSGHFYRSPEALMRSSASDLRQVLAVMERERRQAAASAQHRPTDAEVSQNNADYEMATTGHDRVALNLPALGGDADTATGPRGQVTDGEHVESGAPGIQTGFLDLAGSNATHFSPENIRLNWTPKHQLALDLARQWGVRHPGQTAAPIRGDGAASARAGAAPTAGGGAAVPATAAGAHAAALSRPDPAAASTRPGVAGTDPTFTGASNAEALEGQAWLASGFSDHYLTDAFAAGHLISGHTALAQAYYAANADAIATACWHCAVAEGLTTDSAQLVIPAFPSSLADATRTVTEAPQRARTWVEQLEQEIYRQYGVPR
jgi:hypothetical protein